ncbi:transposase [Streptomyces sp. NBC_01455]|uniref:transposase n=1 Tax=Streptomyces sp. NBC_01455 TaxID=2903874 RepID=UPI003FCD493D
MPPSPSSPNSPRRTGPTCLPSPPYPPSSAVAAIPRTTATAEWALLQPLLPIPACQTKKGGRPEAHPRREIVDAIRYITDNATKWRALPTDCPPWETVYGFFARWNRRGVVTFIRDQLRRVCALAWDDAPTRSR